MKFKFMIAAIGMLAFLGTTVKAQEADDSRIKILPTAKPGVVMVLYAIQTDEPVEVKFMTENGAVISSDKIKGGPYPKGLSKRYDVRQINESDFWIEVSSSRLTVTYHLVPSEDRLTFVPYLEKTTYNHIVVASK